MPDLPEHPMQHAVGDLLQVLSGVHGTLASIDASNPGREASHDEQIAFLDALRPVIAEAQLSLALASGSLASCLRQQHANKLN